MNMYTTILFVGIIATGVDTGLHYKNKIFSKQNLTNLNYEELYHITQIF